MSDKFARISLPTAKKTRHDLSSPHITTTDFGRLDVVYHAQMVEGDDFNASIHSILKAAPMPQPTMGKVYLNVRAFFVPNRILVNRNLFNWDDWRTGLVSTAHPYTLESVLVNKYAGTGATILPNQKRDFRRLLSQLGFPARVFNRSTSFDTSAEYNERYNVWACCAYNRIWWDWYRDSNLIDDSQKANYVDDLSYGYTALPNFQPRYVCYPKDYFTTAKLNPQEGSRVVSLGSGSGVANVAPSNPNNVLNSSGGIVTPVQQNDNIQWLRAANSLQRYLERNNIAGGRVMSRYYARFGATPDSVRLDQSEYVGGFSSPLNIGDVTSPIDVGSNGGSPTQAFLSDNDSLAAQQAGKGYVDGGARLNYHATEDGTFMILASLVPEVYYYQGIPADLLRGVYNNKEDYFTPEFENLGFEPILKKQVAANRADLDGTAGTTDNEIFGFQPRYSNYKFKLGTISGDMVLSETQAGMQGFNLFRNLVSSGGVSGADLLPGFTMILPEDRYQFDRIFSIMGTNPGDFDHFWGLHYIENKADRPMSGEALPSLEEDSHSSGKFVTVDNGGVRM